MEPDKESGQSGLTPAMIDGFMAKAKALWPDVPPSGTNVTTDAAAKAQQLYNATCSYRLHIDECRRLAQMEARRVDSGSISDAGGIAALEATARVRADAFVALSEMHTEATDRITALEAELKLAREIAMLLAGRVQQWQAEAERLRAQSGAPPPAQTPSPSVPRETFPARALARQHQSIGLLTEKP